ncbi:hypothetical protein RIF29_22107 [Crotalaria pallida]|uniref:Pectinesterase n=1 Tax=Crotalaria pallida TaxID=3830 RepID=A0AAN9IE47_CROPI
MSDEEEKKKAGILYASAFILVAMAVIVVFGLLTDTNNESINESEHHKNQDDNQKNQIAVTMKAVKTLCNPTDYKQECEQSLTKPAGDIHITDKKDLVKILFNVSISKIGDKLKETELLYELEKEPRAKMALETCKQLMILSIDEFVRSIDKIAEFNPVRANHDKILTSLKVWLSGSITYQDTCLDGFENTTSDAGKKMKDLLAASMHMSSNALAIITDMADRVPDKNAITKLVVGRRLLQNSDKGEQRFHLPAWVENGASVRRLIEATRFKIKPNVTVALDGSGDVKKINEALKKVPEKNEKPFVIYIKEGVYNEYVEISKDMKHVVFFGDDGKKTRITGNRNYIDGFNTYKSATIEGYLPRQGPEDLLHSMHTCFYSEYNNSGPGSDKSRRASWAGIWNLNSKTTNWFSPRKFFDEDDWIESTGIPYNSKVHKHDKQKPTLLDWLESAHEETCN